MLRRCVSAAAVLLVLCGFVVAGTYQGLVTKLDKDSVTIKVKAKVKGEKGEEKTIKLSKDVKILKFKSKTETEESSAKDVTDGIEAATGKAKGVRAKIETEGEGDKEVVTKITHGGGKKKKAE
jgi:hypothetical protein